MRTDLASDLPPVMADAESIKRVIANLVDNAAEATRDSLLREIHISTALVQNDPMSSTTRLLRATTPATSSRSASPTPAME